MKLCGFLAALCVSILAAAPGTGACRAKTAAPEPSEEELYGEAGAELWEELEMEKTDSLVNELLPGERLSFSDLALKLIRGEFGSVGEAVREYLKGRLVYEVTENRSNLAQLLLLAAGGAVFAQLAAGFGSAAVSETGFHIVYLMMFGLLMSSFAVVYELAGRMISSMTGLMRAALPVFYTAVAFSGKAATSAVFAELTALAITLTEWIGANLLIPGVKLFLLLTLADNLAPESMFSRLSELVRTAVEWGSKTAFGLILGMSAVRGMSAPAADSLSSGTLTRVLSALPGIGGAVNSAAGLVLGSARLVKNGIGAAAMICLVLVCALPAAKLAAAAFLHGAAAAVLEPIADKRLTAAVAGTAQAMRLLLKLTLTAAAMFFLTVALICGVTG